MIKTALYPASKISRSFWGGRDSKNWNFKVRYPDLYNLQEVALKNFFRKVFGNRRVNILDLGCADGSCSIFLVKEFLAYGQGGDISPKLMDATAAYARTNNIKVDFFT
jgi:hypothetical protein